MRLLSKGVAAVIGLTMAVGASAQQTPPADLQAFRDLYKELVETNTSASVGDCTLAAAQVSARLRKAGYADSDIYQFAPADYPKAGGIIVDYPGTDASLKPILLLAHLDVVEAKREDWVRDPFKLIEEGGYFYGRGTSDDKAQAAIWADSMIRFRREGYKPKRGIKMALTCGEEGGFPFNGAEYLANHERARIDAAFALNEGRGGELDDKGVKQFLVVEAGEKVYQDFQLEVTNPGGHSSQPVPDNAIYRLAAALVKLSKTDTPVTMNDTTRAYFTKMAAIKGGEIGRAMLAIIKNPKDKKADTEISKSKAWHAQLRTTCVATMEDAGHAKNALPQRARANINCRIFPGVPVSEVHQYLVDAVADKEVAVTEVPPAPTISAAPPLTPEIMGPIEALTKEMFPTVPIVPTLASWGTDGRFLNGVGIPTYGIDALFRDPDLSNIHGLNERVRVQSLYDDREFLFRLTKLYAGE
jgi:acetylornithine deacetylase/succinyl-diaminopimelate desuccinylase-like protein